MIAWSQVVTTLAPIGPDRGWSRSRTNPVQAVSSHQLTSRKATIAPTMTRAER